jgi:hypothetical protein
MAERKSLMDGISTESSKPAAGKAAKGGGMSGDKVKLLAAVGIFVVAGVIYLFSNGVIGGSPKAPPPDPEIVKAHEEQQAKVQADIKAGKAPPSGGE